MYKNGEIWFLVTVTLIFVGGSFSATNLDTLQAAQVLFRHGARNIDNTYPTDPYRDESLWPGGFYQLTCIGKIQGYNLGRYLRSRYDVFIKESYAPKEVHILSSDMDRTIQTAYSVLAGFYPPNEPIQENMNDCSLIQWESIPVHTIPQKYDNILRQATPCPRYKWLQDDFYDNSLAMKQIVEDNRDLLEYFSKNTGDDIIRTSDFSDYYDALVIENYYNLTLPEWTKPFFGTEEAIFLATFYFRALSYTDDMKRLRAGPFIQQLLDNFNNTINGTDPKTKDRRMYIMSGHDHTMTTFLDTLGLYPGGVRPPFASAVLLELHKVSLDDESQGLEVQLYFRNETGHEPYRLEIPKCGVPCLYETFVKLTEPFIPSDWNSECLSIPGSYSLFTSGVVWAIILISILVIVVLLFCVCKSFSNKNKYSAI